MNEYKQILLIEDRPFRQQQFLKQNEIEQLKEFDFFNMPMGSDCEKIIEEINNENADLEAFDLIIAHRSRLNSKGLNYMNKFKKDIILFSGGLSQIAYDNKSRALLSVNSSDLYNPLFINFIEDYGKGKVQSLLELKYGDKWKLEILLRYRLLEEMYHSEENEYLKVQLEEHLNELKEIYNEQQFPEDYNKKIDEIFLKL